MSAPNSVDESFERDELATHHEAHDILDEFGFLSPVVGGVIIDAGHKGGGCVARGGEEAHALILYVFSHTNGGLISNVGYFGLGECVSIRSYGLVDLGGASSKLVVDVGSAS